MEMMPMSPEKPTVHRRMSASDKFGVINIGLETKDGFSGQHNTIYGNGKSCLGGKSSEGRTGDPFRLKWRDMSFRVHGQKWVVENCILKRKPYSKQILQKQSGEISSGTLTAVMGPSGAGKSTLLNCFSGRYNKGLDGNIFVSNCKSGSTVSLAFVPQKDALFSAFTVKETILFASKMKNGAKTNHEKEADEILKSLNLEACSSVKLGKCSGGQLKRVAIGVELISRPDIIVLDEPTSGLDSSTAAQCILLLRRLTKSSVNPPAIVATIHQPNYKVFNCFHNIYVLSRGGQKIYFGPPSEMVSHFAKYGLNCPAYCNPADYAIEVAYGDYGLGCFPRLEQGCASIEPLKTGSYEDIKLSSVIKRMRSKSFPVVEQMKLILVRTWKNTSKYTTFFLIIQNVLIATLVSFLWKFDPGADDGCWDSGAPEPLSGSDGKGQMALFDKPLNQIRSEYLEKVTRLQANSTLFFAVISYLMMVSLLQTVLSFPLEIEVVRNEINNNWYRVGPYFWAKTIADVPHKLISLLVAALIVYILTGQLLHLWRFALFYLLLLALVEICQNIGTNFGIIWSKDLISATLLAIGSGFPAMLLGGFMVPAAKMAWLTHRLSLFSYVRHCFESILITIYGFGRCPPASGVSFLDLFAKAQDPLYLAANAWRKLNISPIDIHRFSAILDVDKFCLHSLVNLTTDKANQVLGQNSHQTLNATSVDVSDGGNESDSYVLSLFQLTDNTMWLNVASLLSFILVLKTLTYVLLLRKTRK